MIDDWRIDDGEWHHAVSVIDRDKSELRFYLDGISQGVVDISNVGSLNAGGIPFAPTLGDVGCTLSHPASSSHRALTEEGRAALGISEGYFRLSVGIEPPELVLAELDAALAAVRGE